MDPESEFLARKQESGNEWELFKENVRPLKRGRNVALLNHALRSQLNKSSSLVDHRRKLIEAIDRYQGPDPLQPWIECIKWVQEAFPPGGECSGLVLIYEQCVRAFWHQDRYRDDLRYLKVWLEYAQHCQDAQVIFSFLEANAIGLSHSSFYIAYALHMESKNKIKTADDIFNRAISVNAQPTEKLKAAYKKFLSRSMRQSHVINEDATENHLPPRSFGTVLTRGGTQNQMSESSDLARKKLKQDRTNGVPLAIYKENGTEMAFVSRHLEMPKVDSRSWHTLGVRAERNKENNAVSTKWTLNKIPVRSGPRIGGTTPTPRIEVFVDEECEKEQKVEEGAKSSVLQLRNRDQGDIKKETELLRENPLRNFPPTSLPR